MHYLHLIFGIWKELPLKRHKVKNTQQNTLLLQLQSLTVNCQLEALHYCGLQTNGKICVDAFLTM